MLKIKNSNLLVLLLSFLIGACNLPAARSVSSQPPSSVQGVGVAAVFTPTAVPATVPPQVCSPFVTANTMANVRSGPDTVYNIIGAIPQGGTAPVAGKNSDGTWWYIQFAGGNGGYAWIAGSVTTATCIPNTLAQFAAPPPPPPPDVPASVPTKKPKKGEPTATPVPPSGPIYTGPILINPALHLLFPTATPPIVIPVFPTIHIPFP